MKSIIYPLTFMGILIARPGLAALQLPPDAADCVRWAAGDVTAALTAARVDPAAASIQVKVEPAAREAIPESFALQTAGGQAVVTAPDPVGAMYGLQELAEQVRNGGGRDSWASVLGSLRPTQQHPASEFRGDNAFIQVKPLLINDVPMWKSYIDMLARARFNVLDLHGGFDLHTTGFPNLYPMLIHVPEYPMVGDEQEQKKNLEDFRTIISYAKSRGIRVTFMNYAADVKGVTGDKLADYTAKAVAGLIKALPDLYMLGFRVGETGQKASFFQEAYLKGVAESGRPDIRLYTRSWLTTQDQLSAIGEAAKGNFDIEIKYNGEQLGLPYHALQGGFGSYSYQGYIKPGEPFRIIWQVRANGTHRFWGWEDTDFIRRTVRTFPLGDARGFTLEPQTSYFDVHNAAYYKSAADGAVFPYRWQKNWMWYFAWGRLSYNPGLPESTLIAAYRDHFGPAGDAVYHAMQASGPIVPMALAYRFQGPDHRDHSPETETGMFQKRKKGTARQDLADAAVAFANSPMDPRSFEGIHDFVKDRIAGRTDGRVGPVRMASLFAGYARATRAAVDAVPALTGQAGDEWRLLKADLLSASCLSDYYCDRILGTLHLDYALQTGSQPDYDLAVTQLAASRKDWQKLADTADAVYAPLLNPLRGQVNYQWASQEAPLEKLDARLPEVWAARGAKADARPLVLTPEDEGAGPSVTLRDVKQSLTADHVTLTGTVIGSAPGTPEELLLWTKPMPSEAKWSSLPVTVGADHHFTVTVPLPVEGLLYQFEIRSGNAAGLYPDPMTSVPYRVISSLEVAKLH